MGSQDNEHGCCDKKNAAFRFADRRPDTGNTRGAAGMKFQSDRCRTEHRPVTADSEGKLAGLVPGDCGERVLCPAFEHAP